jgi:hypothetical protein
MGLTWDRRGNNIWILAQSRNIWDRRANVAYAPASLMNSMFAPPNTSQVGGGYGWFKPWLFTRGAAFRINPQPNVTDGSVGYYCDWFRRG